jgi:UDP-GlcNAc3NAcA epimerase
MNYKIVTVLGARPQFVKAAAFSRALAESRLPISEYILHTGQHFDANMSEVFFEEMEIPEPSFRLSVNNLGHGAMTGRMLEGIEAYLQQIKPHFVLVYGDTNSTLAGALSAAKLHIPVAHIEAGLRSFNMKMPEEINRILTDRISNLLFCPTDHAVKNLKAEGFDNFPNRVIRSGDVMQDAAMFYLGRAHETSHIIEDLNLSETPFILCTIHRAENTDDPARLRSICEALNEVSAHTTVVLPLHPRTRKYLDQLGISLDARIIPPVGYFDMLMLLSACRMVFTDSGGVQKEAYFFNKYCITMRDQTEWLELVEGGYNQICGADKHLILKAYREFKNLSADFDPNLYGGGKAAEFIVAELFEELKNL